MNINRFSYACLYYANCWEEAPTGGKITQIKLIILFIIIIIINSLIISFIYY